MPSIIRMLCMIKDQHVTLDKTASTRCSSWSHALRLASAMYCTVCKYHSVKSKLNYCHSDFAILIAQFIMCTLYCNMEIIMVRLYF